jgi:DNA mismatch repair protein MutS2
VSFTEDHTASLLEFDKVLDLVRRRAPSSLGRHALKGLRPGSDRKTVLVRQAETSEMRSLRAEGKEPAWGGSQDISPQLEQLRAEESWIEPAALRRVAEFAEASEKVGRSIRSAASTCPHLAGIAKGIPPLRKVSEEIRKAVADDDEISDNASPELKRIRRKLELTRREVISSLERFLSSPESAGAVQEQIITRRGERYVIPVKAGSRGAVRGLVHDRSASGQTLFVEPEAVVGKNNALRELQSEEREEVLRILRRLGALVRERSRDLRASMEAMGGLEAIFSRAVFSDDGDLTAPVIFEEAGRIDLAGARHPLLGEAVEGDVVPVNFSLGGETRTLVLTGPNTGGKTVALKTLKTIGLLCLMAQSGLHIPAQPGSGMSCFSDILADIGDEQSIQQSLSTFSGHMKNIISVLRRSGPDTLVLLDELGAGTDPSEGAAIGIAVLEEIHSRGGVTVATTHHNAVKVFASKTPGVTNASMEFDSNTLRPTFKLVKGVPGRSQAFHIAARLGLADAVLERARGHQASGEAQLDSLVADLEGERSQLARERALLEEDRRRAWKEAGRERERLERKRGKIEERARRALREAERELEASRKELRRSKSRGTADGVKASVRKMHRLLEEHTGGPAQPPFSGSPPALGDRVFLRTLRAWGRVEGMDKESITAVVDGKRCTFPLEEIEKIEERAGKVEKKTTWGSYTVEIPAIKSSEIDIRGYRIEEGLAELDRFIEHALLNGLSQVSVIHGKGTGRLQEMVREYLAGHPRVEQFDFAPLEEGGAGMTRVKLSG